MGEIIEGYATTILSIINFLFTLKFSDGVSVGGFILAVCALSLIIRFIFRSIQAGPGNVRHVGEGVENVVVHNVEKTLRGG